MLLFQWGKVHCGVPFQHSQTNTKKDKQKPSGVPLPLKYPGSTTQSFNQKSTFNVTPSLGLQSLTQSELRIWLYFLCYTEHPS